MRCISLSSIKPGKIVIVTSGRYAGRKAIVVKIFDDGTRERAFGHALIAGIDRYPLAVTKAMNQKKIIKRSKVKPFIKFVNYNHIMPTRFSVDIDVRAAVNPNAMKKADSRMEARKEVKKLFEQRCVFFWGFLVFLFPFSVVRRGRGVFVAAIVSFFYRYARFFVIFRLFLLLFWCYRYLERGNNTAGVQYFYHKLRF